MRVIADHARCTAFLIADGVFPTRASASTRCAGSSVARCATAAASQARRPFMADVCDKVIDVMSAAYPICASARP